MWDFALHWPTTHNALSSSLFDSRQPAGHIAAEEDVKLFTRRVSRGDQDSMHYQLGRSSATKS